MQLLIGTYAFPANSAEVTSDFRAVMSPQMRPLQYDVTYNVTATIDGDGDVDLSAREIVLRAALMQTNFDFSLLTNSGKRSSATILSKDTLTGTRVSSFAFGNAQGSEFVNRRTVQFSVVASYAAKGTANAIVQWRETVSIQGNGGPRYVWRFPIRGPGIRQLVSTHSLVQATQTGTAVGFLARPLPPVAIWPQYLVNDGSGTSRESPELSGNSYKNFTTTWSYRFERGDGPLIGFPGLPPEVI